MRSVEPWPDRPTTSRRGGWVDRERTNQPIAVPSACEGVGSARRRRRANPPSGWGSNPPDSPPASSAGRRRSHRPATCRSARPAPPCRESMLRCSTRRRPPAAPGSRRRSPARCPGTEVVVGAPRRSSLRHAGCRGRQAVAADRSRARPLPARRLFFRRHIHQKILRRGDVPRENPDAERYGRLPRKRTAGLAGVS